MRHLRSLSLAVLAFTMFAVNLPEAARSDEVPSDAIMFGAWVQQSDGRDHYESVLAFERAIGRRLAISHHYRSWDNQWWDEEARDVAAGRVPLITWGDWGRTSAESIANGAHDGLIREKASAIRNLAGRVMLRWAPEMAGGQYGGPSDYIRAWRRIQSLFQERGANNVEWVWCPTAFSFRSGDAQRYYPGDADVDWICADGYNWYPEEGSWKSFDDIFQWFYAWGRQRGKPLMIAENGVMEDPARPGRKAEWFDDLIPALKARPAIRAFVYFHARSPKGYEFWADSSQSALAAFARAANSPYAMGSAPAGGGGTVARRPHCTVTGTRGDDVLRGTAGRDIICGGGGDDRLSGFGGDDLLRGGRGHDHLLGGPGRDAMWGAAGRDVLDGRGGRDRQEGGPGNDRLRGGAGADRQDGGIGTDVCRPGAGDDVVRRCE